MKVRRSNFVADHMDSDLQFVLADSGVSLTGQVAIARHYGNMRKSVGDTRAEVKAKLPTTTEEYRRVMRIEMNAWLAMAARYRSKAWLHGLTAEPFHRFVDIILGEKVLNIQVPSLQGDGQQKVKPDWSIVLSVEHKLRKEAMKLVTRDGLSLADSLGRVIRDAELKETYFTTPLAFRAVVSSHSDGFQQNKFQRFSSKGSSKSAPPKGKGKSSKGKGKEIRKELLGLQLAWHGAPLTTESCALDTTRGIVQDPDVEALVDNEDSFATGVPLGVEAPLPRSPQVYPEKVKHRKLDGSDFNPVADNYQSAQLSSADLEKKFLEEELLGRMYPSRLSVLKEEFGEERIRVASMAAIIKPDGTVRLLHDSTHSVRVSNSIVYRDQIQCPGPAEVAAVVRESVESREAPFCVSADIKAAHRLVKIRRRDWPYMCCRFVGYLMINSWFLHLVYVDDLHGSFTGLAKFENLWIWVLAFELVGTPFAYHKFRGGYASEFVGYQLRYDLNEFGIFLKRGEWLVSWIRKAAERKYVVVTKDSAEFLGRLGFVAQLLAWLKPHLSPLFAWSAATSSSTVAKLPDAGILTLQYLLAESEIETFTVSAKRPRVFSGERFRTDAKCTSEAVVLGGWEIDSGRWFQICLDPTQVPYLFIPGKGAQGMSTSAELLVALAGLVAFGWTGEAATRKQLELCLTAGTDNRGNEFLSQKRATTKWPLMAINMQLSAVLSRARIGVKLKWIPREENTVADDITKSVFVQVDLEKRIDIGYSDLPAHIIHALWDTKAQFDSARLVARAAAAAALEKKRRRYDKSPW
eukprot:s890_g1.t1